LAKCSRTAASVAAASKVPRTSVPSGMRTPIRACPVAAALAALDAGEAGDVVADVTAGFC